MSALELDLPFGITTRENPSTNVVEMVRSERVVAWIDRTLAVRTPPAFSHWVDTTLGRMGIAPVRMLPTHRPEPEPWEPKGVDPGYLWHLFLGRDPDDWRRAD